MLTPDSILSRHNARIDSSHRVAPSTIRRSLFTVADRTISYHDAGDVTLPTILWWHGGPGEGCNTGYYTYSEGWRHIQVYQPGIDQSSGGPGWSPEQCVDDVASLLTSLGITSVVTAGWSWGSTMSLLFAQRHPRLTSAIVVGGVWLNSRHCVAHYMGSEGTRDFYPAMERGALWRAFGELGDWSAVGIRDALLANPGLAREYAYGELGLATPGADVYAALPSGRDGQLERFAHIEADMMARGEMGEWELSLDFPQQLAGVPLVCVQGRYDQVCRPAAANEVAHRWPGESAVVYFNGGHGSAGFNLPAGLSEEQERGVWAAFRKQFQSTQHLMGAALDEIREGMICTE